MRKILSCTILFVFLFAAQSFAEERFFEIRAKKFVYTPNIIKVDKGDLVRVRLISEDVHHGFFLDGYGINTSAYPGEDGHISFRAERSGRFSFRCSVTCGEFHPYMVGYLVVVPNLRFLFCVALVLIFGLINFLFVTFRKRLLKKLDNAAISEVADGVFRSFSATSRKSKND